MAGAKSAAVPFVFSFSVAIASNGQLTVNFSLPGSKPTEGLFVTYIVFVKNGPVEYSAATLQNPPTSGYDFIGVVSVIDSAVQYAGLSISVKPKISCVGGRCSSSCISQKSCSLSGGQIQKNVCYLCMLRQSIINGACSGGTVALSCGNNQARIRDQCVCVAGYVMVAGVCYQTCGENGYSLK